MKTLWIINVAILMAALCQTDSSAPHRRQKRSLAKLMMHIYYDPVRLIRYYHAYDLTREVLKSWRGILPTIMMLPFTDRMPDTYGVTKYINPTAEPIRGAHSYAYSDYKYVGKPPHEETYLSPTELSQFQETTNHQNNHQYFGSTSMMFANDEGSLRNNNIKNKHQADIQKMVLQPTYGQAFQVDSGNSNSDYPTVTHRLPNEFQNIHFLPHTDHRSNGITFSTNQQNGVSFPHEQILWTSNELPNSQDNNDRLANSGGLNHHVILGTSELPRNVMSHHNQVGEHVIYVPTENLPHEESTSTNQDNSGQHVMFPEGFYNSVSQNSHLSSLRPTNGNHATLETTGNGFDHGSWPYVVSDTEQVGDLSQEQNSKPGLHSVNSNFGGVQIRHTSSEPTKTTLINDPGNETVKDYSTTTSVDIPENAERMIIDNVPFVWQRLMPSNKASNENTDAKRKHNLNQEETAYSTSIPAGTVLLQIPNIHPPSHQQNIHDIWQYRPPIQNNILLNHNKPNEHMQILIPTTQSIHSENGGTRLPLNVGVPINPVNRMPNQLQYVPVIPVQGQPLPNFANPNVVHNTIPRQMPQNTQHITIIPNHHLDANKKNHVSPNHLQYIHAIPIPDQQLQGIAYQEYKTAIPSPNNAIPQSSPNIQSKPDQSVTQEEDSSLSKDTRHYKNNINEVSPQWTPKTPEKTNSDVIVNTTSVPLIQTTTSPSNEKNSQFYQNLKLVGDEKPIIWTKQESPSPVKATEPSEKTQEVHYSLPSSNTVSPPTPSPIIVVHSQLNKPSQVQVKAQPFYNHKVKYYPVQDTQTQPPEETQRLMLIMTKKKVT